MQAERTKMSEKDSFLNAKYKCESCLIVFNTEVSMKTHRSKKHEVSFLTDTADITDIADIIAITHM